MRASGAQVAVALAAALTTFVAVPAAADPLLDAARAGATLRRGDRGPAVRALQQALGDAGHRVAVDGVFGGETDRAVRAFQLRSGCAVDGVVGRETMAALDAALSGGGTTPRPTPTAPPPTTPRPATPPPSTAPGTGFAPRPAAAPGGAAVMNSVRTLSLAAREAALLREVRAGNVPEFLRRFAPVTARSGGRTLVYHVAPDYLAVGHDGDFVRIPLSADAAQAAADATGCLLPTTRVVDQVFAQAAVRLAPQPLPPTAAMTTVDYFVRHHRAVETQRGSRPLGGLTAGHKKDVVLTNRLASRPGRVAIYGWHRPNGLPIQPLSLVHEGAYADYSHGVRLVAAEALLDGRSVSLVQVLRDPALAGLLSAEGALQVLRAAR